LSSTDQTNHAQAHVTVKVQRLSGTQGPSATSGEYVCAAFFFHGMNPTMMTQIMKVLSAAPVIAIIPHDCNSTNIERGTLSTGGHEINPLTKI
jgi:hypothetical protein